MTLRLRGLFATSIFTFLTACGGGGGGDSGGGGGGNGVQPPPGSSLSYVGATTPANLTSSPTVPELPAWLLIELGIVDSVSPGSIAIAAAGASETAAANSSKQKGLGLAKQLVSRNGKPTAQAVSSESCSGGGTREANDDALRDDGTGTLIVTYRACIEGGAQLDGVFRFTIAAFDVRLQQPTDFTVSLENVRISTGSSGVDVSGTVRTLQNVSSGVTTSTHNTVARYSPQNVYTRLQDFVETAQSLAPNLTGLIGLSYQGRFYQSQHGYVDVQTTETVRQSPGVEYPLAGELRLTGATNSRVLLRFDEDQPTASIAIDSDGDGAIERGLSSSYQQLITANPNYAPFAHAGADVTINEEQSVTLDGSGSRDWENGALTYSWSVTVPAGSQPVAPGVGPSFTFTASEGGVYLVHLAVSDGQSIGHDVVRVNVRDNAAPTAVAGNDHWVFERAAVRLDASASRDYEGDALQFTWTQLQAPAGSAAPASFAGMTAELTADLPGEYIYELRVTDAANSSTDHVRIVADAVLSSAYIQPFAVSRYTEVADTTRQVQLQVNPRYSGPALPLTITSNTPWLRVDTPNVTTASSNISVSIDLPQLATLMNGSSEASLRIAPANDYRPLQVNVSLFMQMPIVRQVSPYVVYAGQPTWVALYGDGLGVDVVDVSGIEVPDVTDVTGFTGRIRLPALAAGEYQVRMRNRLGVQFPPARLLVRDAPSYLDEEVALPGAVQAVEYDAERDVFYAVFVDNGSYSAQRLVRQQDGMWRADSINVPDPRAVTLTADGTHLLITSANCGVHGLDVGTLAVLESTFKASCVAEDYGIIHGFASGQVMIGDSNQWSTAWRYPDLRVISNLPSINAATAVLSYDRTRMIWAEGPSISAPREIYAFETSLSNNAVSFIPNDTSTYFLRSNLAISGDGKRIMHREDVYNEYLNYVGSLPGISGSNLLPALSRQGTRAAVLDPDTDRLSLFNVANGHTIALIQDVDTFASDVVSGQLLFFPDDTKVFAFTQTSTGYRLFVRNLP